MADDLRDMRMKFAAQQHAKVSNRNLQTQWIGDNVVCSERVSHSG